MAATSSRTPTHLARGENPQWLYTVRFNARDLWGPDADPNLSVSVDAWEPYLEPTEQAPKAYCAFLRIRLRSKG